MSLLILPSAEKRIAFHNGKHTLVRKLGSFPRSVEMRDSFRISRKVLQNMQTDQILASPQLPVSVPIVFYALMKLINIYIYCAVRNH